METAETPDPEQPPCHLLRLPAEIREEIYRLTTAVAKPWPGITGSCKQVRAETLPRYLNRTFVAPISGQDESEDLVLGWLHAIRGLPAEVKENIRSVHIHSKGRADFELWDGLLVAIEATGLTGRQLVWPGLDRAWLPLLNRGQKSYYVKHMWLFYDHLLVPLLHRHGLFDPARPPPKVWAQVMEDADGLGLDTGVVAAMHQFVRAKTPSSRLASLSDAESRGVARVLSVGLAAFARVLGWVKGN